MCYYEVINDLGACPIYFWPSQTKYLEVCTTKFWINQKAIFFMSHTEARYRLEEISPVAPIVVQGEADVTVGNRVCQMWGSSRPHSTGKYGEMVDSDAGHNGCRNPSGSSGGVWCRLE